MKLINIFLLAVSLSSYSSIALSNEHEEAPAEHGEEKKADAHGGGEHGGGEHGSGEKEGAPTAASKSQEWIRLNTVITSLASKVTTLQADIKDLIKKKRATSNRAQLDIIWEEISAKHKELEDAVRQYMKEANRARFDFPDKGSMLQKKYRYVRMKSIDEMESEVGIEAKLTHGVDQVQRVYRGVPKNTPVPTPTPGIKPTPTPDRIKVQF